MVSILESCAAYLMGEMTEFLVPKIMPTSMHSYAYSSAMFSQSINTSEDDALGLTCW